MKKSLILCLLLAIVSIMATGCSGCQSGKKEQPKESVNYHDYDGVVQDFTAGVSHIQALHRQTVHQVLGVEKYEWRNSKVIFSDEITYENINDLHITDVNDVFFYVNEQGPWVQYVNSNVKYGLQIQWPIRDIWIEDKSLNNADIKINAEDALKRLKEWNGVIPKGAKSISLRLPVGPKDCNAQWVLGSISDPLFIDAVTGDISNQNPAF